MDPVIIVCAVTLAAAPVAAVSHLSAAIAGGSASSSLILISLGSQEASWVLRGLTGLVAFSLVATHALSASLVLLSLAVGFAYLWQDVC